MEGIKNLVIDFGGVIINLTRNRCIEAFESLGVANIREQIVNKDRARFHYGSRVSRGYPSSDQTAFDGRTDRCRLDRHAR